jgi:Putative polyhydroxyalkanoic acid system protein (PHA_gran_rgn)
MAKPLTVTISHDLGKEEVKRRLRTGLGQIRAQITPHVASVEDEWTDDNTLAFRVRALAQTVTGRIEVLDDAVRVEVLLPGMLSFVGKVLGGRIRKQATLMLEKK